MFFLCILLVISLDVTAAVTVISTSWKGTTGSQDWFLTTNWNSGTPYIQSDYLTSGKWGCNIYGSSSPAIDPIIADGNATAIEVRIGGAAGDFDKSGRVDSLDLAVFTGKLARNTNMTLK
jgi:hypothetical protein